MPQKEDPAVHDKLRARFEAMERRGHLGQKLGGSQQQLGINSSWFLGMKSFQVKMTEMSAKDRRDPHPMIT